MTGAAVLALHVVLWHAYVGAEEQALTTVVKGWNAAQALRPAAEQVLVEQVAIPFGSLADKLQAGIPRGHGPDLYIIAHNIVGEWSRYGLIEPLGSYPQALAALPGLLEQTVAPLRSGGKLWGLPLAFKSLALFYRTDLLPAPPRTTDELLALCQRLRQEGDQHPERPRRYCLAYEAANYHRHSGWLHGFGGSIYPKGPPASSRPKLDTPQQEAALSFVTGLARRRDIPDEMTQALVSEFFNQGRAATVINGPWFIGQIDRGVPYGVAPLPVVSPTGLPAAGLTTIEGVFLSPRSPHKDAALGVLRYLAGPESARVRALVGGQSVSDRATWDDPAVRADPVLAGFHRQLDSMVAADNRPEMRSVWDPAEQALRQAIRGALTPRQALHRAQLQLDVFLKPLPPSATPAPYLAIFSGFLLLGASAIVARLWARGSLRAAWRSRGAYGYLLPTLLSMGALVFVPFAVGAGMSLFVLDLDGNWRFVGMANFLDILLCRETSLLDPLSFYYTLLVTLLWTVLNVALHVLIGGSLALLLRDPLVRLRGVYRMLLLLPWAIPNYITALIWKGMFNRQFGAINGILNWLGLPPVAWFSSFLPALCANVATNVWLGFPFMMVVSLGVLAQIPREVEEAAMLDGASGWQRLRHIILPLLGPALLPSVLLGAVWTFNMFNVVFLVSAGEPDGATDILVSQAYRWAFTRGHRYGYAAAYAVLIFVVLLIQSALLRRYSEPPEQRS